MPAGTFGADFPGEGLSVKPKPTVTCYICGREYGSSSYGIHEKQCIEKYVAAQKKLPTSQRRPLPTKPRVLAQAQDSETGAIIKLNNSELEELHENSFQTFMEEGREACPHCGRKFLSDRLQIHLRSCKPDGYFAKHSTRPQTSDNSLRPVTAKEPQRGVKISTTDCTPDKKVNKSPRAAAPSPAASRDGSTFANSAGSRDVCSSNGGKGTNLNAKAACPVKLSVSALSSPQTPVPKSGEFSTVSAGMFCGKCGTKHREETDRFCTQCGEKR